MIPMIFASLSILLGTAPSSPQSPAPVHSAAPRPAAATLPDELFSRRALRQARIIIQMRLLQLGDERLECVREALMRRLPDALWPEEPSPSRGAGSTAEAVARCAELLKF